MASRTKAASCFVADTCELDQSRKGRQNALSSPIIGKGIWPSQQQNQLSTPGTRSTPFVPASNLLPIGDKPCAKAADKSLCQSGSAKTQLPSVRSDLGPKLKWPLPKCNTVSGRSDLKRANPGVSWQDGENLGVPVRQEQESTWPQDEDGCEQVQYHQAHPGPPTPLAATPQASTSFPWPAHFLNAQAPQVTAQVKRRDAVHGNVGTIPDILHCQPNSPRPSRASAGGCSKEALQPYAGAGRGSRCQQLKLKRPPKKPLKRFYAPEKEARNGSHSSGEEPGLRSRGRSRGAKSRGRGRKISAVPQCDRDTFGGVRH